MWDNDLSYDSTMATYWQTQLLQPDTRVNSMSSEALHGSIFSVEWARAHPAGLQEDRAIFSVHFAVRAGIAGNYAHLDTIDTDTVHTSFSTHWMATMQPAISNQWSLAQYTWRNFGADFPLDKNGVSKPGPIWRVAGPLTTAGGDDNVRLPDQDALTVTYRTCSRKHWGRNYVGGLTMNWLALHTGHAHPSGAVDKLALAFRSWYQDLWDNPRIIEPVIWSAKYRGIMSINELAVDDVVDIVRRRRAKGASYRKVYTS